MNWRNTTRSIAEINQELRQKEIERRGKQALREIMEGKCKSWAEVASLPLCFDEQVKP